MLSTDYKIKFNNTEIPFPASWSEDSEVLEKVYQSESGIDKLIVQRKDKLKISMNFNCLATLASTLGGFSQLDSFTFKRYNPRNATYEERTVRMRKFTSSFVKKSEDLSATNGIWKVSFTLEEF